MTRRAADHAWKVRQAHRMRSRGAGPQTIAQHLGVTLRTVQRYLAAPVAHSTRRQQTPRLDDALCRRFPDIDFTPHSKQAATDAIALCRWCPIRRECAQAALDLDAAGVWAGVWVPERQYRRAPARELLRGVAGQRRAAS